MSLIYCTIHVITDVMHTFLAPRGAPQNLSKLFVNDTTITIQWEPVKCRHHNGEITGYSVTYYHGTEMTSTRILPELDRTFTATGLIFNEMYTFEVLALSRQYGSGPSTNITLMTSPLQGINILHSVNTASYQL